MTKKDIKITLEKLARKPLNWFYVVVAVIVITLGCIYRHYLEKNPTVLIAVTTSFFVVLGYFVTHYLEISRKQKEQKFYQCLKLVKKLRFFILEKNYGGKAKQSEMRDELQEAYFSFSLLTSEQSYKALSEMMEAFKLWLSNQTDTAKLGDFKTKQSKFINSLRKEFAIDGDINFETYDFQLETGE